MPLSGRSSGNICGTSGQPRMVDISWDSLDITWDDLDADWFAGGTGLNDWEFRYNSITIGGNNDIGILDVKGFSTPDIRQDTTAKVGEHGGFDYSQWLDPRYITIHGDITDSDPSNFADSVDALKGMFVPQASDKGLTYQYPGIGERIIYCKPLKGPEFAFDRDFMILYTDWVVQLIAADPRMYDAGAVSFLTLNSGNGYSDVAVNSGNWGTKALYTITGPGDTFTISNGTDEIIWNGALASAETCVIDTYNKTCLRVGVNDFGNIGHGTKWFDLTPGNTTIVVTVGSGSDGNTTIDTRWRSAWL